MKSIKQQYIDLREGNMSQANFMRNLRMTMPQYITNVTSFDDSVKILKNKGILTEADIKIPSETLAKVKKAISDITANNDEYHRDGYTMGFFEGEGEEEKGKKLDEILDPIAAEEIAIAAGSYESAVEKLIDMGLSPQEADKIATDIYGEEDVPEDFDTDYEEPNEPFDMAESLNEAKDEKTKWTNTSSKSMYDTFKEIDNLNAQEVITGLDWEMEKNPEISKADAAKIVIKNIKKNPLYYTMTDLAGKEGAEAQYMGPKADIEARQMQYLDKNMSNVVDKKMGMQPVKGIEKAKKDSDKGGETNKTVKGVELMSLIAKTVRGMKKMDATGEKMKKISVREGMESMNKINVNDEVKIDPEEIESINKPSKQVYSLPGKVNMKLNSEEIYKVKSILGMDAKLEDSKGNEAGYVNMSNLIKVIDENTDREKYRDDYNARARSSDTEQAKKDAEKNKKDTETQLKAAKGDTTDAALASFPGLRERLKELIRKEIKESAGAYDYGDDMSADDINEADDSNIYLVASPEKNSGELWSLFSNSENLFRAGYWKMTEEMFNQMMMPSNPSIYKFNNELWFVYTNRNGKLNVWPMDPKYKSVDVISTKNTKEEAVKDAANRAELVRADFRDSDKKLDTILNKAAGDIDSLVKQIGNDTKLGWDLYKRARVVDPSLADDLAQALNLYNK
jgi:hypothetical protein